MKNYDVIVIGGGPAGLAASISAYENGAETLIVEREEILGGILKQCIHDGFGLVKFGEKLSGPEYAIRYINMLKRTDVDIKTSTFVSEIEREEDKFKLKLITSEGILDVESKSIVLACGCRERTSKQVFIYGERTAGIYNAGTAQYFINILGYLPCKKCVILGSGDIGLIMARRLTLEGAEVLGVYEAKSQPSGLTRNIVQCLEDFSIPLYLSHTITRVFGHDKVEAVEICEVDKQMNPIKGTEEIIQCDGIILSVGLIPENEIAEKIEVKISRNTKGPIVDQNLMTSIEGVFSCGNSLHVNDLVDYVSESGETAGKNAALFSKNKYKGNKRKLLKVNIPYEDFLYVVPQYIDIQSENKNLKMYVRSKEVNKNPEVKVKYNDEIVYSIKFPFLRPPEMKKLEIDLSKINLKLDDSIEVSLK
ncbi:NAD(P)/FAD-dependent oxidoreductase [Haloimpatiens sp. FM7330]|uniref:NAD(P)/FAD-dependent oxidoreductase n=1 Tax=Haloimpatiens sp. FM7330 TaxID=3298610 RepID=UPI0036404B4E